ncbi:hypothetical protein AbraIFM66950_010778 [Aspergillus brasiliensis]|nr:hypothetical protein AbraIFM66950_010778 [Aspergillus brasiliensis]
MPEASAERKLIFGVDVGTMKTYHASDIGVSYAMWAQRRPKTPDIVSSLSINKTSVFPTTLAYRKDKSVSWGRDAQVGNDPVIKWLKLFLYDQEHPILSESPNPALPDGVPPEQLISDYLRQLYAAIQKKIVSMRLPTDTVTDFWFSWPAGWSADNQQTFARAVRAAGFASKETDNLFFLTEAEAAALYFMYNGDLNMPEDCRILVCDVGGGTTDIGAFHVQGTGSDAVYEPLGKASGVNGGVAAMDAAVRQHIKDQPPHTFGLARPLNEDLLDRICALGKEFDGSEKNPLRADATGQITVPPTVLKDSLNSTVVIIIKLIMANIAVILTGGGSMVPYLLKQIKEKLKHTVALYHLDKYKPTLVSWGATYRGILGRAVPRLYFDHSYGLQAAEEAIVHNERKSDPKMEREKSPIHWFIRKNQAIEGQRQNEHYFDIHYRGGDAAITIIHLLRHTAEFPDANDEDSKQWLPLDLRLQDLDLSCLIRIGDEYSVPVRIAWEVVEYKERRAIVKFTAQSKEALLGVQDITLDGCRLVE